MYLSINILLRGRIRNMFQEKQEYYLSELQSNLIALALIALLILYWTVAITIDCRATLQMFTGNYGGHAGKICNIYGKGL